MRVPLKFIDASTGAPLAGAYETDFRDAKSDAEGRFVHELEARPSRQYFRLDGYAITAVHSHPLAVHAERTSEPYVVPLVPVVTTTLELAWIGGGAPPVKDVSLVAGWGGPPPLSLPSATRLERRVLQSLPPRGQRCIVRTRSDPRVKGSNVGGQRWEFPAVPWGMPLRGIHVRTADVTFELGAQLSPSADRGIRVIPLRLGPSTLHGRIAVEGGLPGEAQIRVRCADGIDRLVSVDAEGHYRVGGLPAGEAEVILETQAGLVRSRRLALDGSTDALLDWDERHEPGRVAGIVIDERDGTPVPFLPLHFERATDQGSRSIRERVASTTTGADGRFDVRLPPLAPQFLGDLWIAWESECEAWSFPVRAGNEGTVLRVCRRG